MRLLFLAKKGDPYVDKALAFARERFDVTVCRGEWGDPLPAEVRDWDGDVIVSYLSRWVVPTSALEQGLAINFHPAPPEYPGIGCFNFALYDGVKEYGVTCHYMRPKVDTGDIIAVRRFPVFEDDNVASLMMRTYRHQLALFYDIMERLDDLPSSAERWTRPPITRKQFNELRRVTPDMTAEELTRRVRATDYGPWRPTIELHGYTFELKSKPLVGEL